MTNLPPPDRRSSPLGFDEFVAVLVAFTVIGTIFAVSLRQREGKFSFNNSTPAIKTAPTSPTVVPTAQNSTVPQPQANLVPVPAPVAISPTVAPTATTSQLTPQVLATTTPESQVEEATVVKKPNTTLMISPPVAKSSQAEKKPISATKTVNFPDVPKDLWARPYIEALAKREVLTGYKDGNFRPSQPVTRAEFAANLQKAFEHKVEMPGQNYTDIAEQFWAYSAIQETTRSGFLRGYPDQAFRPDRTITRVEALVSLTKGLGLTANGTPNQLTKIYQDAKNIPNYAKNVVAVATEYGLVINYPNLKNLNPNKPLTRAEAAALTYQGMVQAGKVPAINSKYLVKPE